MTALEKGERRIRLDELISLAGLYGRQVSTFVGSRVSPNQRPPGGWWRQELRTRRSSTRGDGAMGTWWPGIPGARSRGEALKWLS